jgi:hypothetical protein
MVEPEEGGVLCRRLQLVKVRVASRMFALKRAARVQLLSAYRLSQDLCVSIRLIGGRLLAIGRG